MVGPGLWGGGPPSASPWHSAPSVLFCRPLSDPRTPRPTGHRHLLPSSLADPSCPTVPPPHILAGAQAAAAQATANAARAAVAGLQARAQQDRAAAAAAQAEVRSRTGRARPRRRRRRPSRGA